MKVLVRKRDNEHGQATVEFALLLPVFTVMLLGILQVALIGVGQLQVVHAAREGARRGSVALSRPESEAADGVRDAVRLDASRVDTRITANAQNVDVVVTYQAPTEVPLVGALFGSIMLTGHAAMRREQDSAVK